ncbi:MAG: helix-turn-helix domain-containing protein [Deltaproteobacteria bacterium]|nr:helix-turn-helix domain-containing protein [Deltaproteobacteria bacterium]
MAPRKPSRPVRIHLLVFPRSTPIVPVGLLDLLRKAGALAEAMGQPRAVEVALVAAARRRRVRTAGGLELTCHHTLADAPRADHVVVSPADPEVLDEVSREPATTRFLRRAHAAGATLASVCIGAFTLAQTGLLDGRPVATHWAFQGQFRARFPRVELRPQEILVDAGRLLSTGGATSFLNFALYLIERLHDAEVARAAARMFLIDERKSPQGAYAIFAGQKQHGDEAILRAQELLEHSVADGLGVEAIAARVAMARRTFIRRFKAATGTTPRDYQQRVRIEAAKRRLEASRARVSEVASAVGYSDQVAFRRLFQRQTGLTPTEYRQRYGQVASPLLATAPASASSRRRRSTA